MSDQEHIERRRRARDFWMASWWAVMDDGRVFGPLHRPEVADVIVKSESAKIASGGVDR